MKNIKKIINITTNNMDIMDTIHTMNTIHDTLNTINMFPHTKEFIFIDTLPRSSCDGEYFNKSFYNLSFYKNTVDKYKMNGFELMETIEMDDKYYNKIMSFSQKMYYKIYKLPLFINPTLCIFFNMNRNQTIRYYFSTNIKYNMNSTIAYDITTSDAIMISMRQVSYEWDNVSTQMSNRIEKSLQDPPLLHNPSHNNFPDIIMLDYIKKPKIFIGYYIQNNKNNNNNIMIFSPTYMLDLYIDKNSTKDKNSTNKKNEMDYFSTLISLNEMVLLSKYSNQINKSVQTHKNKELYNNIISSTYNNIKYLSDNNNIINKYFYKFYYIYNDIIIECANFDDFISKYNI